MNRPPRKRGPRGPKPIRAAFDPEDRALIEDANAARLRGETLSPRQQHVCDVIDHAAHLFVQRIIAQFPNGLPTNPDDPNELFIRMCKPATFFDDYVSAIVIQELATGLNCGIARGLLAPGPTSDEHWGRCPDVIFPNYTPRQHP